MTSVFDSTALLSAVLQSKLTPSAAATRKALRTSVSTPVQPPARTAVVSKSVTQPVAKSAIAPQSAAAPVSYINNIKPTGDKTIDPLLAAGNYWWNTGVGADGSNPSAAA